VQIYTDYQKQLRANRYFDFEDMLLEVNQAFKHNLDLKYRYQEKFLYLLVDEFQDTNAVQIRLIKHLTNFEINDGKPNIMVVGDDDLSIFKFQKATLENILDFEKTFAKPKIIAANKSF
jgi:DNA helicase-2/ATP-dependent DNA helicase PcrA